jgi:hypothetical protein
MTQEYPDKVYVKCTLKGKPAHIVNELQRRGLAASVTFTPGFSLNLFQGSRSGSSWEVEALGGFLWGMGYLIQFYYDGGKMRIKTGVE